MNIPYLVNKVDVMPSTENTSPAFVPFENPPDTEAKRADIDYFKNILIIPRDLETVVLNRTIKLHVDMEFSGGAGAQNAFRVIDGRTANYQKLPLWHKFASFPCHL